MCEITSPPCDSIAILASFVPFQPSAVNECRSSPNIIIIQTRSTIAIPLLLSSASPTASSSSSSLFLVAGNRFPTPSPSTRRETCFSIWSPFTAAFAPVLFVILIVNTSRYNSFCSAIVVPAEMKLGTNALGDCRWELEANDANLPPIALLLLLFSFLLVIISTARWRGHAWKTSASFLAENRDIFRRLLGLQEMFFCYATLMIAIFHSTRIVDTLLDA